MNKELRGFFLGQSPLPVSGQELFKADREKSVGWITSGIVSPAFAQTVALGYLQREVEPADELRIGSQEGPPAQFRALNDEGWILD